MGKGNSQGDIVPFSAWSKGEFSWGGGYAKALGPPGRKDFPFNDPMTSILFWSGMENGKYSLLGSENHRAPEIQEMTGTPVAQALVEE